MPGPKRFPSANLFGVLERDKMVQQTRRITCIIGTASRRGDTGGSPTFKRGSFLLSLLAADGMRPRLCRPKRHRALAREAELGAIPPHPVKHHTDPPGQNPPHHWPGPGRPKSMAPSPSRHRHAESHRPPRSTPRQNPHSFRPLPRFVQSGFNEVAPQPSPTVPAARPHRTLQIPKAGWHDSLFPARRRWKCRISFGFRMRNGLGLGRFCRRIRAAWRALTIAGC